MLSSGGVAAGIWRRIAIDSCAVKLALSIGSAAIVALPVGVSWLLVTRATGAGATLFGQLCFGLLLSLSLFSWWEFAKASTINLPAVALIALGILAGGLYLSFAAQLFVPQYFDALEHVRIVNDILHPENVPTAFYTLERFTQRYYHFGFHILGAWCAAISGVEPRQVVLALGSVLMAGIPFSVFFFTYALTGREWPSVWAALFATLAWAMPAYGLNWGKYPALIAIAVVPICLGMIEMWTQSQAGQRNLWLLGLLITGLGATLIHSRALIVIGLYVLSRLLAQVWQRVKLPWRIMGVMLCALGVGGAVFASPDLLDPYRNLAALLMLLLMPLALRSLPRQTVTLVVFVCLILVSSLVTGPFIRRGEVGLLDRPFIQMLLFIPFAGLIGVGLAAVENRLPDSAVWVRKDRTQLALWLAAGIGLSAVFVSNQLHQPNVCCQFVYQADLSALTWMADELPQDATIVISGFAPPNQAIGNDGGIWISTLIGRPTYTLRYDTNWAGSKAHAKVCQSGARYIYAGSTPYSFKQDGLNSRPDWYTPLLRDPPVGVYAIRDCPK